MNETVTPAIELPEATATSTAAVPATPQVPNPDEIEGDFATGERTLPKTGEEELHEGDFAAGERTEPEVIDPESELHGDFAAGERTEVITEAEEDEGSFSDTSAGTA